jgi:putative inorganic carbon (HCO3(-)) transporter
MSEQGRRLDVPPAVIIVPLLLGAVAAGRFIASGHIGLSIGVVIAIPFLALVLIDLLSAVAAWAALLYVSHLSVLSVAPNAIELLLFIAWIGAGGSMRGRLPVIRENRGLTLLIAALGIWLSVSAAWAQNTGSSLSQAGDWWQAILVFAVVATTFREARDVEVVALAFVIGSVVSVAIGLAGYGGPTSAVRISQVGDRLTGGGGDPNYQAAAFLAAMFLVGSLITSARARSRRTWFTLALAFITIGFLATQSRGGLVALAVAVFTGLLLLPAQRGQLLKALGVGGVGLAGWVIVRHDALSRLTNLGGGTDGRSSTWTVAWRIFKQRPFAGVGLANFTTYEPHYVLQPGPISDVHLVAEAPEYVHNAYLQLMAETGVVGLLLFVAVAATCVGLTWSAVRRFERLGATRYAALSQAVMIGTIAMLSAIFFISDANDFRLWILFAMGVALSTLSRRLEARSASLHAHNRASAQVRRLPRLRRSSTRPRAPSF